RAGTCSLETAIAAMKQEEISDADIDTVLRKNPAKPLGLGACQAKTKDRPKIERHRGSERAALTPKQGSVG
ncbi:MAG: hypothetical protein ABWY64_08685, partial [Tardiphaga sp.]